MKAVNHEVRRKEILDSYFDYFKAYTQRQWDNMIQCLSDGMTMFGTGIDEVAFDGITTRSFLRREFQQAPMPVKYVMHKSDVFEISENVAMLMLIMDMHLTSRGEPIVFTNNRTTAIMARENGKWKLVHGHWSQPDKDIDVGESVPYRLLMERSRQLEEKVLERTRTINDQKNELQKLNQTKDKLLSVIAHDLKNPFNSILGFSELLAEDPQKFDYEKLKMMCLMINQQAQSAYALLENLLEWVKSQTGQILYQPGQLQLVDLIDEAIGQTALSSHQKQIDVLLEVADDLLVYADRYMLQTVLRNLLSNAIKFTNHGGNVKVIARTAGNMVRVTVKDDGVGIDKEKVILMKQGIPVEATKGLDSNKGSGLGLLLCREFIHTMGGVFQIESKVGEGSTFSFTLPQLK